MPREIYPDVLAERSRTLYAKMKEWGHARNDVTLLGGWAVFEHVDSTKAQRSKDIDIVLHSGGALGSFESRFAEWNIQWRTNGRRAFKDCHFRDDSKRTIIIDVFTTDSEIGASRFGMEKATNLKPGAVGEGFIPSLAFLVADKIETVPRRVVDEKRLKDLLDLYHLAFFNKDMALPDAVLDRASKVSRATAASCVEELSKKFSEWTLELAEIKKQLLRK